MIALRLLLISSPALSGAQAEDEDVLYYEDIKSQDLRDQFDRAPLISKSVTKSDWCKVINYYALTMSDTESYWWSNDAMFQYYDDSIHLHTIFAYGRLQKSRSLMQ